MRVRHLFSGTVGIVAVALGAAVVLAPDVQAGKPGGGGGGTVEGGVVYVEEETSAGVSYVRYGSDGSGRTVLAAPDSTAGAYAEPSYALHGGRRWFLQAQACTPPDGTTREEWFAVADDGTASVRLTDSRRAAGGVIEGDRNSDGAEMAWPRWVGGADAGFSFTGRANASGTLLEGGIYCVELSSSDWSAIAAGSFTPRSPSRIVSLGFYDATGTFVGASHAWSPAGTRMLWNHQRSSGVETPGFWVWESGTTRQVRTTGGGLVGDWGVSSGKDLVVYKSYADIGLRSLDVDGTADTLLVADPADKFSTRDFTKSVYAPRWSPQGGNLAYDFEAINYVNTSSRDVYVATSAGVFVRNLTSASTATCRVLGWR